MCKETRNTWLRQGVLFGTLLLLGWGSQLPVQAATLHHFDIQFNPAPSVWTAGVPQWCTITAYEDAVTIAAWFGDSADLNSSLDHNSTLKAISPQSITFASGIWQGNITLYRASRSASETNNFSVNWGVVADTSYSFIVQHNVATKMVILETSGMSHYPGISPDVDPMGDYAVQGQPSVQTAGTSISRIDVMLCDAYWNRVTQTAEADAVVTLTCSDPYPANINGVGNFVGGNLNVTLTDGLYSAINTFRLYTVNGTNGQTIGVTSSYGRTPFTLGVQKNRVPVKHANDSMSANNSFRFILTPTTSIHATAGVPFAVTVVAIDAYGNTLDSINGAIAMSTYKEVSLASQTDGGGNKSIWPIRVGTLDSTRWQEGKSYPWVYCYKSVAGSQYLTAYTDFGNGLRSGNSHIFSVDRNGYARVVPIVTGMSIPSSVGAGGTYTYSSLYDSEPPAASASVFNNFGTPAAHTAGNVVNLVAYACDIYGNTVIYPNSYIHMSSSDSYAPSTVNYQLSPTNGYADFTSNPSSTFRFHTQGTRTITCADANVATMTAGTTPLITVYPGTFYGLQAVSPGLVAIEGSGNTNVSGVSPVGAGGWYSGVTTQNPAQALNAYNGNAQFAGTYFPVSVQAVDMYGNFINSAPSHTIELRSDDLNSNSEPNTSTYLTNTLSGGTAYFLCQQRTDGPRSIKPYNMSDMSASMHDGDLPDNSSAIVRIVSASDTDFRVYVEGVLATDNIPVYVDADPNTFTMRVEIRYRGTGEIVNSTRTFLMEPSTTFGSYTPATGTLGISAGSTLYGVAEINAQTYSQADTIIYIRVRDAGGSSNPSPGYSGEIRVRALATPTVTATVTVSATATPSPTITMTPTHSPVVTKTVTETYTASPTLSATPTISSTSTISATLTSTQTSTVTSTISETSTITQTSTITTTATITPTATPSATHTPLSTATSTATSGTKLNLPEKVLAYPNPAKGEVHFVWTEEALDKVSICIYNLSGECIATLQAANPSSKQLVWESKQVAPGLYLFQMVLTVNGQEKKKPIQKLAIVK